MAWQVLTDVVRRVTGRDIHDRMRKLVLQPSGARDSGFRLADAGDDQAMGYSAVIGGVVENHLPFDYEYRYSVQDGNPRVRVEALTDQPGASSAAGDAAQGLGWGVFSDRPDAWAHSGGDLGTNTIALVFPGSKSSVVAISNPSHWRRQIRRTPG